MIFDWWTDFMENMINRFIPDDPIDPAPDEDRDTEDAQDDYDFDDEDFEDDEVQSAYFEDDSEDGFE
jgi:hypothetical protein